MILQKLFSLFKMKEPSREEIIAKMRHEEIEEFQECMRMLRQSSLPEKEKAQQRKEVIERFKHVMSIIK